MFYWIIPVETVKKNRHFFALNSGKKCPFWWYLLLRISIYLCNILIDFFSSIIFYSGPIMPTCWHFLYMEGGNSSSRIKLNKAWLMPCWIHQVIEKSILSCINMSNKFDWFQWLVNLINHSLKDFSHNPICFSFW